MPGRREVPGFGKPARNEEAAVEGGTAAGTAVETDVEAPEVFSVEETGLWDGRPSLGGVWVAHPDVKDPERVLIRNAATGQSVVGALFRRERDNPGPRIQASSDAADALGLLAGQPATLTVVALRRETVAVAPPVADGAATLPPSAGTPATAKIEATVLAPAAPVRSKTPPAGPKATVSPAEIARATSGLPAKPASPSPAPAAATAPAAAATPALDKPYIQVGIFNVEANADAVARSLRAASVNPTVRAQQSRGKKFWRVIAGPATTEGERRAILAKLRGLGFADAYYVTN